MQVVDLGSGSGGIMPRVVEDYNAQCSTPIELLLTDLHPSEEFRATIEEQQLPHVHYRSQSLNATQLQEAPWA